MTTAARPTYYAAIGKQEVGGMRRHIVSGKDQTAHTRLKFRQPGQGTAEDIRAKDLKYELELKEQKHEFEKNKAFNTLLNEEKKVDVALLLKDRPEVNVDDLKEKYDDADIDEGNSDDEFDSSSEEDDDDEDDDEAELQAELDRIRQEKEEALLKKQQEEEDLQDMQRKEAAMEANPLARIEENSAKIKRRWNDDVVFRNQARDEPQQKKRFINDTIRSDFHRSFLKKFMK